MKKPFLFFAVACVAAILFINQVYAQSQKIRVGVKAGIDLMTLSTVSDNDFLTNYNYRVGLRVGVYADVPLASDMSLVPQVLYAQKGGNAKVTGNGLTFRGTAQLNYFDVPLLFGFKPLSAFTFFAGPQFSFLASRKTVFPTTNNRVIVNTSTSGLRKTILGGNLGVGYNGDEHMSFNLHYLLDFQGIISDPLMNTGEKSSGFELTANYLF